MWGGGDHTRPKASDHGVLPQAPPASEDDSGARVPWQCRSDPSACAHRVGQTKKEGGRRREERSGAPYPPPTPPRDRLQVTGHHTGAAFELPGLPPLPAAGRRVSLPPETMKVRVEGGRIKEIRVRGGASKQERIERARGRGGCVLSWISCYSCH